MDEKSILAGCLSGDRAAWNALVQQYSRYVYFLINATAKKHGATLMDDEAADLHNDFFLALLEDDFRRLRAFRGQNGCSLRSWLRVITIRRTIDALRKRRKQVSLDDESSERRPELIDEDGDALDQLLEQEQAARRDQLGELTAQLSPTDRLLLEMIYIRKLGAEDIAAALRIRKGAVYTRKTRLIQRLRAHAEKAGLVE